MINKILKLVSVYFFFQISSLCLASNYELYHSQRTEKLLELTITKFYQNLGNGEVNLLVDEFGNMTGLTIYFNLKGKKEAFMGKSFDELQNNLKIEHYQKGELRPAIIFAKSSGTHISAERGGDFQFSILSQKPATYIHYSLTLKKQSGRWFFYNKSNNLVTSLDLTPNVSNFDWDGTFSVAKFSY